MSLAIHRHVGRFVTMLCCIVANLATAGPATQPAAQSLFDGKTLAHWKAADFAGGGEPGVEDGAIVLPVGERITGVTWTGDPLPMQNYEISLTARRMDGSDFFCGLTFPVDNSSATLVLGGWGGTLCGISSLNDEDASHNETKTFQRFETGKWYHVRLRVTPGKLQAWVDDKSIVDTTTTGKKISIRNEMEASKPLGLTSFQTQAQIKDIKLTPISPTK